MRGGAPYLGEERPVYQALGWASDGLKVARIGYTVTATGRGVDVSTPVGNLLVRLHTNYTVSVLLTLFEGLGEIIL